MSCPNSCFRNRDCFACTYCVNIHNDAIDGRCPATCYRDGVQPPAPSTSSDNDNDGYQSSIGVIGVVVALACGGGMAILSAGRRRANERRAANDNRDAAAEVPPMYRENDTVANPQYDNEIPEGRASATSGDGGGDEFACMLPSKSDTSADAAPVNSEGSTRYMEVFPAGHSATNPFTDLGGSHDEPPGYNELGNSEA